MTPAELVQAARRLLTTTEAELSQARHPASRQQILTVRGEQALHQLALLAAYVEKVEDQ